MMMQFIYYFHKYFPPFSPIKDRLSTRVELPMIVRMGHYDFDNKPLLGKLADIQVWDKVLR